MPEPISRMVFVMIAPKIVMNALAIKFVVPAMTDTNLLITNVRRFVQSIHLIKMMNVSHVVKTVKDVLIARIA
jgi:hypothetical protein